MPSKPVTLEALQARAQKLSLELPPATSDVLRQKCIAIEREERQDRQQVAGQVEQLTRNAVATVLEGGSSDFGGVTTLEAELAVRSSNRQHELAALEAALSRESAQTDARTKAITKLRDEVDAIQQDLLALQAHALRTFREALALENTVRYRARLAAGADARRVSGPPELDPRLCQPQGRFLIDDWFDLAKKDGYDGPR